MVNAIWDQWQMDKAFNFEVTGGDERQLEFPPDDN
jgi:hypothetical protein